MGKHSAVPAIIQWTGLEQETTQKAFDMTALSLSLTVSYICLAPLALHTLTHNPMVQWKPRSHSEFHRAELGTEPAVANQRWTQSLAPNQKHP